MHGAITDNRLSASSTLHGINSGSFSYNPDDELSGELYDANGNVTATGGKTFGYDSHNRLTSMNGGAVRIVYDGDGNRVAKTANGVTTQYLVDDLNPTGYPQVVEELVNGAPEREYTYGLERTDEDQVIQGAWVPSFYGYDGFGTVRQLTNAAGAVTDTWDYDAFGNVINSTGTTPNEFLYRGEQYDPDLGIYYLRARWMNPVTGRFVSRDPEDGVITDPATLHKYLYASGDPINRKDPSGRDDLIETGEIDEELSTAENKELEEVGQRVNCVLQTAADTLQFAIAPSGETLLQLLPDLKNCNAEAKYKKLHKCEEHHIWPRYLGGPKDGPTAPINGLYHQHITNAFRACWPYGIGRPSLQKAKQCMEQVYQEWPLNSPQAACVP